MLHIQKNVISDARIEASKRNIALFLGAGVDSGIAGTPGWGQLVGSLIECDNLEGRALEELHAFSDAISLAAKHQLGEDKYYSRIGESLKLDAPFVPFSWKEAFVAALDYVSVFVTTNYSPHIRYVLESSVEYFNLICKPEQLLRLVVTDRKHLRGVRLPSPGTKSRQIHLVYLHGKHHESKAHKGTLVLDSDSYWDATTNDSLYTDFLASLFQDWNVLSVGVSFTDAPVLQAATRAKALRPETHKHHLWVDTYSSLDHFRPIQLTTQKVGGYSKPKARGVYAAYGVHRIEVGDYESIPHGVRSIFSDLDQNELDKVNDKLINLTEENEISRLASEVEEIGDYEAQGRLPFFSDWGNLEKMSKLMASEAGGDNWDIAVRLERNIRHHLYLFPDRGKKKRTAIWKELASLISDGDNEERLYYSPELGFDFLLGSIEVGGTIEPGIKSNILSGLPVKYKERFHLAERIWPEKNKDYNELISGAIGNGWESIECKLALEQATSLSKSLDQTTSSIIRVREQIIKLTDKAKELALFTGRYRRYVTACILQAYWMPTPDESQLILKPTLEVCRERNIPDTTVAALLVSWGTQFGADFSKEDWSWDAGAFLDAKIESPWWPNDKKFTAETYRKQVEYWKTVIPLQIWTRKL